MVSRILLGTYNTTGDMFWFCMEVCVDLIAFCLLIRRPRRRETGVTCANDGGPKGERKRLNSITLLAYPRSYIIFTELPWSMWSIAIILNCALRCYFCVFQPFKYGFICLFALPCRKKPPDLVSEGGKIRVCSNYYFINRQRFLAKVLRKSNLRKLSLDVKPAHVVAETPIEEATEVQCEVCADPDIQLDDPVVMLRHDHAVFDRLKQYAWMAGASVNLDSGSARVLRDALDSSINLASGLTAVILDTDFPDGIEPCEAELQGIGAGLRVRGKGKVRWQLKSEGKFMMSKNGIFFELNEWWLVALNIGPSIF